MYLNILFNESFNFQRNEELELKFADISKVNLDLQKTERELRDQIVTSIPKEHVDQLEKRVKVDKDYQFIFLKVYFGKKFFLDP